MPAANSTLHTGTLQVQGSSRYQTEPWTSLAAFHRSAAANKVLPVHRVLQTSRKSSQRGDAPVVPWITPVSTSEPSKLKKRVRAWMDTLFPAGAALRPSRGFVRQQTLEVRTMWLYPNLWRQAKCSRLAADKANRQTS